MEDSEGVKSLSETQRQLAGRVEGNFVGECLLSTRPRKRGWGKMGTEICLFTRRKLGIGSLNFVAAGNGILNEIRMVSWDLSKI